MDVFDLHQNNFFVNILKGVRWRIAKEIKELFGITEMKRKTAFLFLLLSIIIY